MKTRMFLAAGTILLLMMITAGMPNLKPPEASIPAPSHGAVIPQPTARGTFPPTLTSYNATPSIGTDETEFTFRVEYIDQDNEPPAPGYPRVYIYSDDQGMVSYKDGWYEMTASDPGDTNHTNGKMYLYKFFFDEHEFLVDGTPFSYRYEVKSSAEPETDVSPLHQGPEVDWVPLFYRNNSINSANWYTIDAIDCSVIIDDGPGTGVDGKSIEYRYARGNGTLSRWFPFKHLSDSSEIFVSHEMVFHEGDLNYFQWKSDDRAGTGPVLTEAYRVKVDKTGLDYKDPEPADGAEVDTDSVEFQLTVTDTDNYNINNGINVSGVDPTSLKYRLRYPGSNWGGWNTSGIIVVSENDIQTRVKVLISDLDTGSNYIQFKGTDIAGNEEAYSAEYRIVRRNNVPQRPKWLKPNETAETRPRITWGPGFDPDGDELEYFIQIGTIVQDDHIFSWRSTGSDTYYELPEDLKRHITYLVQVKCFDGLDHSGVIETMMNVTSSPTNVPPLPPTNISAVYTDVNPYICWNASYDPDSGNLTYFIRMGRGPGRSDVFNWQQVPLGCLYQFPQDANITDGIFHIEIQAFDGQAYSGIASTTLKVATFEIKIVDFPLNLTPGDEFDYSVKVLNKALLSDNVTLVLNGTIFDAIDVFVDSQRYEPGESPGLQYYFEAAELRELSIRFDVPEDEGLYGNYTFNIYAYSENGELSGVLEKDYADIRQPPPEPPEKDTSWWDLFAKYWWVIVIVFLALMIGANAAYYVYKKRKGEWDDEHEEDEDYLGGGKEEDDDDDDDDDDDEPPPTPEDETGVEAVTAEPITDEELAELDDLLEPPPEGLDLPEPSADSLLTGAVDIPLDDDEPGPLNLSLPPADLEASDAVEVPTVDAVCSECQKPAAVDVTQDPSTLPCPNCGVEGALQL